MHYYFLQKYAQGNSCKICIFEARGPIFSEYVKNTQMNFKHNREWIKPT